jgi:hypothetical protein
VTTLTGSRDIALTELTGIAWNAAGGGVAGPMNLFGMVSARIRHRGGELLVPMPDGADLLRDLEGVRPELVAAEEGAARSGGDRREFDFTGPVRRMRLLLAAMLLFWIGFAVALMVGGRMTDPPMWAFVALGIGVQLWWQWSLPRRLVRSAVLDGDRLRARTVDGREHIAALADVDLSSEGWASRMNSAPTPLRIPGATLLLLRPAANELVDRLSTAGADR